MFLSSRDIRWILQNAGSIKNDCRCVDCDGSGYQNWDEEGNDIKTGESSDPMRCYGECGSCDGIGYILDIPWT
jgi:hypothetical protein